MIRTSYALFYPPNNNDPILITVMTKKVLIVLNVTWLIKE